MASRGAARRSRVGLGFALLGVVAILGGTFGAGVFVGRYWARVQVTVGLVKPRADTAAATTRQAVPAAPVERRHVPARTASATPASPAGMREPEPVPNPSFYQELTAPLERPAHATEREAARRTTTPPAAVPTLAPASPPPSPVAALPPRAGPGAEVTAMERAQGREGAVDRRGAEGFTVQVGAYGSRVAAESLRATLAAHGFDAGVSAVDTPAGMRYRVRVGTFPTREAATAAMSRVTAQAKVGAIVMRAGGPATP